MLTALILPLATSFVVACSSDWSVSSQPGRGKKTIIRLTEGGSARSIVLPWPVWTVQRSDLDRDGCDELILGVQKRNRFDSTERKRIQVWRIDRGHLRPGWLGTRLSGVLDSFLVLPSGDLWARERIRNRWVVSRWSWHTFGFQRDTLLAPMETKPDLPRFAKEQS